mgnify:FL=1
MCFLIIGKITKTEGIKEIGLNDNQRAKVFKLRGQDVKNYNDFTS